MCLRRFICRNHFESKEKHAVSFISLQIKRNIKQNKFPAANPISFFLQLTANLEHKRRKNVCHKKKRSCHIKSQRKKMEHFTSRHDLGRQIKTRRMVQFIHLLVERLQ